MLAGGRDSVAPFYRGTKKAEGTLARLGAPWVEAITLARSSPRCGALINLGSWREESGAISGHVKNIAVLSR